MYFTTENRDLFEMEKLMRQAPGYRPRRSGMVLLHGKETDVEEMIVVEDVISTIARMNAYRIPRKVQKGILQLKDGSIFRNNTHKKKFEKILKGSRRETMQTSHRYLAAVFLLTSDSVLWKKVESAVTCRGIAFDEIRVANLTVEQYVIFHTAKDIYNETKLVTREELTDPRLVSDEAFRLAINAYALQIGGIKVIRKGGVNDAEDYL